MRNLSEWYDVANTAVEKEKHLHSFNHKRFTDGTLAGASRGNLLEDAYDRFESHLASKPTAYVDPDDAIYDFAKDEVDNIAAGSVRWQDAAAYSGTETLGVSKFAALKSLDFVKDNMSQIGYRNVIFGDFIRDIDRAYDATSYKLRPANQFKVAAKRKIDAAIKAHLSSPTVPVSPGGTTGARTGSPVGMTTLSSVVPTGFGDSPMWLTTPESIQVDRSTPPPDLPEDVTVRSGYAAGMKEALGLLNGAELKRDQTRMAEVMSRDPSATAP
ncbi:hypothetical protein, partial [Yoonia sp.]|uniref:hypothetical protein n=1 Tax=Yoonia sp. TaxID=2212373 RepID=UPI002DF967D9|nr:hypothetical protein [Yoonia sp.]